MVLVPKTPSPFYSHPASHYSNHSFRLPPSLGSRHSATGRQRPSRPTFGQITLISKKLTEPSSADPFNDSTSPVTQLQTLHSQPLLTSPNPPITAHPHSIHPNTLTALFLYSPTAAAVSAPAGAFSIFLHCRSSDCSRRSAICISPLPQQWLLPQERYLYFPTAAAVTAPAGALSVFPHCRSRVSAPAGALSVFPHYRSSVCSRRSLFCTSPLPQQCLLPQERYLHFPTTAVVSAPAGALSVFPHYRSSVCSRRSLFYIPPLPQQWLLPQERYLYFPTAAAVTAPAGALSVFPHCRSSDCSRRSAICISPLPQKWLLPQERYLYFPTIAAVSAPAGALCISPLPQ